MFNYAKLILASHARLQTPSCFCMSCIYVHNDAFHCRHFPRKFLRAIIFNIHHQHQHNRGIRGRGFVTIGHKTSEAAPPPTKPSSFILRLCLCNYLYFSSLPIRPNSHLGYLTLVTNQVHIFMEKLRSSRGWDWDCLCTCLIYHFYFSSSISVYLISLSIVSYIRFYKKSKPEPKNVLNINIYET